jgi:hypothetical protein
MKNERDNRARLNSSAARTVFGLRMKPNTSYPRESIARRGRGGYWPDKSQEMSFQAFAERLSFIF